MLCYSSQRKQEPGTNKQLTRAALVMVWVAELYGQQGQLVSLLGVFGKTHTEVALRRNRCQSVVS